jgi:hypothetical protein
MEKKFITETIFRKQNDNHPIKFGEIKIELKPDDVILAGHDEGYYSENNSWDAHYFLEVNRDRLETDDEFATRCQRDEQDKVWSKQRRYENYLKLKKEFENDN